MKGQKEKQRTRRVAKNVHYLRLHADLTVQGLAAGVNLSVNHVRLIEAGKSNITARTAGKICDFFNIDIATLYGSGYPEKRPIEKMPAVKRFYRDNKRNPQFFISAKAQNSVAYFVREVLLKKKKYFRKKREVSDVVAESQRKEYAIDFKSKAISQELIRLVEKGLLAREDLTGEGKRFLYFEPRRS